MVAIGTRRFGYTMEPLRANGQYVHGGNHYANSDTIEDARAYAERVVGTHITYCSCGQRVDAVLILGKLWEFAGSGWRTVKGSEKEWTREVVPSPTTTK